MRIGSIDCQFNPFRLLDLLAKLEEEDAGHTKILNLATELLTNQVQLANLQAALHDIQNMQVSATQLEGLRRLKSMIFVIGI